MKSTHVVNLVSMILHNLSLSADLRVGLMPLPFFSNLKKELDVYLLKRAPELPQEIIESFPTDKDCTAQMGVEQPRRSRFNSGRSQTRIFSKL